MINILNYVLIVKPNSFFCRKDILPKSKPLVDEKNIGKIDEYKDLALFTQMLLTNTASEASCEREFWKQRKIVTNEKNRTGNALAFTRIVFMTIDE